MFSDLKTFRRRAKQIVYQKTGLASESVHVDFNAYLDRHCETERQLKDIKRVIEGLRDGLRNASQAATSSASAFSALYSRNEDDSHGLTKKYSDAVAQLEDRSRSRAEEVLSEQLTSIETMLNAMDLKAKFDQRKALLLDLDSYKRKVADLKEKDHKNPGKVDQGAMRDKEEKLRVAEKKFTEMNDDLMAEMDQINEQKPELLERELVGVMQATFEFFTGAAKAFSGLEVVLKESRERPAVARSYPEDGAARPNGTASSPVAGFKTGGNPMSPMSPVGQVPQAQQQSAPVSPFGADPFAQASPGATSAGATRRSAAFDYAATEAGELTFTKGDFITVIAEDASGWWQGRNERTGQTGVFPSNYTNAV